MGNEYLESKSGQKQGEMVIYGVRDEDVYNSWIWRASWGLSLDLSLHYHYR